jgi:hypothetical protein
MDEQTEHETVMLAYAIIHGYQSAYPERDEPWWFSWCFIVPAILVVGPGLLSGVWLFIWLGGNPSAETRTIFGNLILVLLGIIGGLGPCCGCIALMSWLSRRFWNRNHTM